MALSFERPWALALWPVLAVALLVLAWWLGQRGWRVVLAWLLRLIMVTLLVLPRPAQRGRRPRRSISAWSSWWTARPALATGPWRRCGRACRPPA
jgi:hypothetical protein